MHVSDRHASEAVAGERGRLFCARLRHALEQRRGRGPRAGGVRALVPNGPLWGALAARLRDDDGDAAGDRPSALRRAQTGRVRRTLAARASGTELDSTELVSKAEQLSLALLA